MKISWKKSVLVQKEVIVEQRQPWLGKIFGVFILSLLILPGLIGNEEAKTSITPLIIWVFLWIGVPVLGLVFGDIYSKFNPLSIIPSPEKKPSTVWFAAALFLGLTWFELVWRKPGNPTHIGIVFILLMLITTVTRIIFSKASIEVDPLHLLHHVNVPRIESIVPDKSAATNERIMKSYLKGSNRISTPILSTVISWTVFFKHGIMGTIHFFNNFIR